MQINDQVLSDLKSCLNSVKCTTIFDHFCEEQCRASFRCSKSDRFLVNLYDRPSPNRFRDLSSRSSLGSRMNKLWIVPDMDNDTNNNNDYRLFCKKSDNKNRKRLTMAEFISLKNRRDVECIKAKEASKVLRFLNSFRYAYWPEKLLAEKVLLQSGCTIDLLVKRIRKSYENTLRPTIQIGTVSVSNFKFHSDKSEESKKTDFFVLLLSNETEAKCSKIARSSGGEIVFNEKFTFPVNDNFKINVQLHSIPMTEASKLHMITKFLIQKKFESRATCKLQYKNINTTDFEEIEILETSFKLRAQTEITSSNLHSKTWKMNLEQNSRLRDSGTFTAAFEDFKIDHKRSGFLTLGQSFKSGVVWNRRWCVLDSECLKIYNSPSEVDFVGPQIVLDLNLCSEDRVDVASRELCNRARSLILNIQNDKYFFMADCNKELTNWITDLNLVLDLLKLKQTFV